MTPQQKEIITATWSALPVGPNEVAARCYDALFAVHPLLRVLFEGFMDEQHTKLADTIEQAVRNLHATEELKPQLKELGRRHRDYGVKDHHYEAVGDALLHTLADVYGPAFTPEAREAWAAFYGELATAMRTTPGH